MRAWKTSPMYFCHRTSGLSGTRICNMQIMPGPRWTYERLVFLAGNIIDKKVFLSPSLAMCKLSMSRNPLQYLFGHYCITILDRLTKEPVHWSTLHAVWQYQQHLYREFLSSLLNQSEIYHPPVYRGNSAAPIGEFKLCVQSSSWNIYSSRDSWA